MAAFGSTKRERLALLLAAGQSVRKAAIAVGVGKRTAYRWTTEVEFKARVQELRGRMMEQASGRLTRLMGKAATRLRKLLDSPDDRVKLAAVRTTLEFGPRVRESSELEERLTALEKVQQKRGSA